MRAVNADELAAVADVVGVVELTSGIRVRVVGNVVALDWDSDCRCLLLNLGEAEELQDALDDARLDATFAIINARISETKEPGDE